MNRQQINKHLAERWPQAFNHHTWMGTVFATGLPVFDNLFEQGGIPYGQIVEINGAPSSGKTGFLYRLLGGMSSRETIAYVDFSGSFFPPAAAAAGVDLEQLLLVTPDHIAAGLRSGELLFRQGEITVLVCDLTDHPQPLPMILLHRLRMEAIRARGLIILLTEQYPAATEPTQVPGSMVALRLEITTDQPQTWQVTVTRSRFCRPGIRIACPRRSEPHGPAGRIERVH